MNTWQGLAEQCEKAARLQRAIDRRVYDVMLGGATASTNAAAQEPLTMDKLNEMFAAVDGMPPVPPMPRFIPGRRCVKITEDWSRCRSRARAERRHKLGKRQNMILRAIPLDHALLIGGAYHVHPTVFDRLKRECSPLPEPWMSISSPVLSL